MFRQLFSKWRSPYAHIVLVQNDDCDVVFGVFSSLEKANDAIKEWKLEERERHPYVLTLLVDYRILTKPPRYWSPKNEGRATDSANLTGYPTGNSGKYG